MDKELCDSVKKHSDKIFSEATKKAINILEQLEKPYSQEDYEKVKQQNLDLDKE